MLNVGFTGSRKGMTESQKFNLMHELQSLLKNNDVEFHHGDCVGSDAEAHQIATILGCSTVIHPPVNSKYRAYCAANLVLDKKPYIVRNKDIVFASDILYACPFTDEAPKSLQGQGTWSTIKFANRFSVNLKVLMPT